jgi:hypothetical protein
LLRAQYLEKTGSFQKSDFSNGRLVLDITLRCIEGQDLSDIASTLHPCFLVGRESFSGKFVER